MQLANATNRFNKSGTMISFTQTAEIVNNIANVNSTSQQVTTNLTDILSNVLRVADNGFAEAFNNGTGTMLVEAFERQLQHVETESSSGTYRHTTPNIMVVVTEGPPDLLDDYAIATTMANETEITETLEPFKVNTQELPLILNRSSNVFLFPKRLSANFHSDDTLRATNVAYRCAEFFFSRYYNVINNEFAKFERRHKRRFVPNTFVIATNIYRNGEEVLTWDRSQGSETENSTLRQWYRPLEENGKISVIESSVCSFWNFRADGGRGNWSTDGCRLVSAGSDGLVNYVPVTFQISRSVNTGMMTIICPVHIRVSHSRFKE
ncbi:putative G-protein coupled receptor [Apostichopus japonicus]|uniref:Putative G-protein coupled receptor n=1 Tax=Stichopus japonicus TaxID=307972 RepID=A0A2G8KSS1_STIJA|nr:putative G-protein coupled receptor [Apostichopus japonicus]